MAASPVTYTFAQFHSKTGGDAGKYNKYLRYVANYRAHRLGALNANPLNSDALGAVPERVEIPRLRQMAHQEIQPLINEENSQYTRSVGAAKNALSGYSGALAQFYQPQSQQIENNTKTGVGLMAAANGALGSTLQAGGAGEGDLARYAQMAGSNPSAIQNYGTTGANLLASRGTAAINGAVGSGIAAANSAAFLPTYAASEGRNLLQQAISGYLGQHQTNIQKLLAQQPDVYNKLYSQYVNNEIQKAIARDSGYVQQTNAATSQYRAANTAANQTADNARAGANYYKDPQGRTVPKGYVYNAKNQLVKQPTAGSKPTSGPGSKRFAQYHSAISSATTKATSIIRAAVKPTTRTGAVTTTIGQGANATQITNPNGRVTGRVPNYYGTIHQIEAAVTPILSPYMGPRDITRWVQQMVNKVYGAGKYGRPGAAPTGPGQTRH